jgi:hypothetical protein
MLLDGETFGRSLDLERIVVLNGIIKEVQEDRLPSIMRGTVRRSYL